jgi:hypothetical protein
MKSIDVRMRPWPVRVVHVMPVNIGSFIRTCARVFGDSQPI